jgi:Protein of unknown function (DUF2490)
MLILKKHEFALKINPTKFVGLKKSAIFAAIIFIHMKKTMLFCSAALLGGFAGQAQSKQVSHQALYWARYYNQVKFGQHFTWHNELENRMWMHETKQHHFIMHSRLHYQLNPKLDVALGLTYSAQSPQEPQSRSTLVVPELRPVQEINYQTQLFDRCQLQQRLRLDERFIHRNNGQVLTDGYDFNLRFRHRLQLNYQLVADKNSGTNLKLSNEMMLNTGGNVGQNQFDQNRAYLGIEQNINQNIGIELGYLYWYQQRASGYQYFDRDIVRLTFYHRLKG